MATADTSELYSEKQSVFKNKRKLLPIAFIIILALFTLILVLLNFVWQPSISEEALQESYFSEQLEQDATRGGTRYVKYSEDGKNSRRHIVGTVKKIDGRILSIERNGDYVEVPVSESTRIRLVGFNSTDGPPVDIDFDNVAVGDYVNYNLLSDPDEGRNNVLIVQRAL